MTVARFGAYGGPALLLVAAIVPPLRPAAAVAIVVGWLVLGLARHPGAIAWAAAMPIAVLLTSPWLLGGDTPLGEVACAAPLSEIAVRRVVMALLVMGVVAGLAVFHRSGPAELGLRRPGRTEAGAALAGCAVLAAGGLVIGPWIARPFFGELSYPVPLAALVPAVLFGIANGVLEELGYRAALQAWLGRLAPAWAAIGFQGLVFGIVHAVRRSSPGCLSRSGCSRSSGSQPGSCAGEQGRWPSRSGSTWAPTSRCTSGSPAGSPRRRCPAT